MKHGSILVTGGAGYIGSHVVLQLRARGERVVVLDDLSRGFRQAVLDAPLVVGKVGDRDTVARVLAEHGVDTVMHFAAYTIVPESVSEPLKYYGNNTCSTRTLLECCVAAKRAALRVLLHRRRVRHPGRGRRGGVDPDRAHQPLRHLQAHVRVDAARRRRGDPAALRGAALLQRRRLRFRRRIGQATPKATLLIKVACEAAVGKRSHLSIFGTDYPTPDGTGVRDYIHVEDLATAHLDALTYLRGGGASTTLNVGYGHGYSVREVIDSVQRVTGKRLTVNEEPRRAGDPPALVARAERIRAELGWQPRLDDLDTIVRTAYAWEQRLQREPW